MASLSQIEIWLGSRIDNVRSLQGFNLLRFGVTLLIGILLAKSGLPTAEIAIYETLLFLTNLTSFFWIGGGQNALLSYFPRLSQSEEIAAFWGMIYGVFQGLALLAGVLLLGASYWLESSEWTTYRWPLFFFVLVYTPSHLVHLMYLLQGRYSRILRYGILSFGYQLLAVLVPVFLGYGLAGAVWGLFSWGLLRFGWLVVMLLHYAKWKWKPTHLRSFLLVMWPLMLHLLIGNSVEYIDGLLVSRLLPTEAFAIFRYGARELPLTTLLVGALVAGLIPVTSKALGAGMAEVKRRSTRLSHLLFPLSGGLMLISPWLFPLVYNPSFAPAAWVFNIYLLILTSRILLPQIVIISQGKNYFLVYSAIAETLLNVGLSVWWIQRWGLEGIAMASVVAYLFNKVNLILYNRYRLGIPWRAYTNLRVYGWYSLGLLGCFILAYVIWT